MGVAGLTTRLAGRNQLVRWRNKSNRKLGLECTGRRLGGKNELHPTVEGYWSANYAGWYGWPLSWNKWDPTKPHRLPEPPNCSILLEENWDDDYIRVEEEERREDYIAWLEGNPRFLTPDQEVDRVEYAN